MRRSSRSDTASAMDSSNITARPVRWVFAWVSATSAFRKRAVAVNRPVRSVASPPVAVGVIVRPPISNPWATSSRTRSHAATASMPE